MPPKGKEGKEKGTKKATKTTKPTESKAQIRVQKEEAKLTEPEGMDTRDDQPPPSIESAAIQIKKLEIENLKSVNGIQPVPEIPNDSKNNNIKVSFVFDEPGKNYMVSNLKAVAPSAALSDITKVSVDITAQALEELVQKSLLTQKTADISELSKMKLKRDDAAPAYAALEKHWNLIKGIGAGKLKSQGYDDTQEIFGQALTSATAAKAIMDSACLGENVLVYIDNDFFEKTTITEAQLSDLINIYKSVGKTSGRGEQYGLKILRFFLRMNYCPFFQLVSSDRLGAFNGLRTIELIMKILPAVATLEIPKGSGGQTSITHEGYLMSIILDAVFTNNNIDSLFPQPTLTALVTSGIELPDIVYKIKTEVREHGFDVTQVISMAKEGIVKFDKHGGIEETINGLDSNWALVSWMTDFIPTFSEIFYKHIDPHLETCLNAIKACYEDVSKQTLIVVVNEFVWLQWQLQIYKTTQKVYGVQKMTGSEEIEELPGSEEMEDLPGSEETGSAKGPSVDSDSELQSLINDRNKYKKALENQREAFSHGWIKVLSIVFRYEAFFGHDNKSKELLKLAVNSDPEVNNIFQEYKTEKRDPRDLDNIPWRSFEEWILHKCEKETGMTIFEGNQAPDPLKVAEIREGMDAKLQIEFKKLAEDFDGEGLASKKIEASNKILRDESPNIFSTDKVPAQSFGLSSSMGISNSIDNTVININQKQGERATKTTSFAAGGGNPVNNLLSSGNIGGWKLVVAYDLENYVSPDSIREITEEEQKQIFLAWTNDIILKELARNRVPQDKIFEIQGILSTLDRASRINHPRAKYLTGKLTIPIVLRTDEDGKPAMILNIEYNVGTDPDINIYDLEEEGNVLNDALVKIMHEYDDSRGASGKTESDFNPEELKDVLVFLFSNTPDKKEMNDTIRRGPLIDRYGIPIKKGVKAPPATRNIEDYQLTMEYIFTSCLEANNINQPMRSAIRVIIQEIATQFVNSFNPPPGSGEQGEFSKYMTENQFWTLYLTHMYARNPRIVGLMLPYIENVPDPSDRSVKKFTGDPLNALKNRIYRPDVAESILAQSWNFNQTIQMTAAFYTMFKELFERAKFQDVGGRFFFGILSVDDTTGQATVDNSSPEELPKAALRGFLNASPKEAEKYEAVSTAVATGKAVQGLVELGMQYGFTENIAQEYKEKFVRGDKIPKPLLEYAFVNYIEDTFPPLELQSYVLDAGAESVGENGFVEDNITGISTHNINQIETELDTAGQGGIFPGQQADPITVLLEAASNQTFVNFLYGTGTFPSDSPSFPSTPPSFPSTPPSKAYRKRKQTESGTSEYKKTKIQDEINSLEEAERILQDQKLKDFNEKKINKLLKKEERQAIWDQISQKYKPQENAIEAQLRNLEDQLRNLREELRTSMPETPQASQEDYVSMHEYDMNGDDEEDPTFTNSMNDDDMNDDDMNGGAKTKEETTKEESIKELIGKPVIVIYNAKINKYYVISIEEYSEYWYKSKMAKRDSPTFVNLEPVKTDITVEEKIEPAVSDKPKSTPGGKSPEWWSKIGKQVNAGLERKNLSQEEKDKNYEKIIREVFKSVKTLNSTDEEINELIENKLKEIKPIGEVKETEVISEEEPVAKGVPDTIKTGLSQEEISQMAPMPTMPVSTQVYGGSKKKLTRGKYKYKVRETRKHRKEKVKKYTRNNKKTNNRKSHNKK